MHLFSTLFLGMWLSLGPVNWETDIQIADTKASQEHKLVLLNFSGSDWCGPCIRMHKEIFESTAFAEYADSHLVCVKADFPRLKKNKLSPEQQAKNDQLAERYNPQGVFPLTVLMTAEGKVLHTWEGLPPGTGPEFVKQLETYTDARR